MTSRPRSRSPTSSSRARVAFSVEPSTSASGMLGPVDGDAQGDHAGVLAEVDAVDQQADQVQVGQVARLSSSARAVWVMATNRRETADFEVPEAACSTWVPTGSSPTG